MAKQLPIRLPAELRKRLDVEAQRLELSINATIVTLLDRHLPRLPGSEPAPRTIIVDVEDDDRATF